MQNPDYFKECISGRKTLIIVLLLFILLTSMAQFASFGLIQSFVIAAFGAQPEDVSIALQITYVGILVALPIQFRLQKYFNTRNYLIIVLLLSIVFNIGCLVTDDLLVFAIFRFLLGLTTAMLAGCMLIVLFSVLPKEQMIVTGSSFFFGSILSCGLLIGIIAAWITDAMDWKIIYYFLIALQIIAMICCFILFKPKTLYHSYPLYQIDWIGALLFTGFGSAIAYVMIYGSKHYWFNDKMILQTTVMGLLFLILFLYRQSNLKRPLIDLRVFRYKQFLIGLAFLALFYGIKDSLNLVYAYTVGVLGWNITDVVTLGMLNVAGIIVATWFSAKAIISSKTNIPKLLLSGFILMMVYHLWMYWLFTPNLAFNDLIIPVILQGIASGLLFVPIIIYSTAKLPAFTGMTGIIVCAYVRFISTLNGISGFYTLQLNFNQQYKESFLSRLTAVDSEFFQRIQLYKNMFVSKGYTDGQAEMLANTMIAKATAMQSQLLTNRAVFLTAAIVLAIAIVALLLLMAASKISSSFKPKPVFIN